MTGKRSVLVSLLIGLSAAVDAAVPLKTSYQGRIKVNGADFTGTAQFKFVLVAKPDGASVWSNDGTSFNGSEPATAVSLEVEDGLFTVLLGDATLPNMIPLSAGVFAAHPEVALRIWVDDGKNGSVRLVPDTVLASVPFALAADVPEGSITGAHLAPGSIAPGKLAAANAPEPGRVLGYDGNQFRWEEPSSAGNGWSRQGSDVHYDAGKVGIGTTDPLHRLGIRGGPAWTGSGWSGALDMESGAAIGWRRNREGMLYGIGHSDGGLYFFQTPDGLGTSQTPPRYDLIISDEGNVGIGAVGVGLGSDSIPTCRLRVHGGPSWTAADWKGSVELNSGAAIGWRPNGSLQSFGIGQSHGGLYFFRTFNPPGFRGQAALYDLVLTDHGEVGMGTLDPRGNRLRVAGSALVDGVIRAQQFITASDRDLKEGFAPVNPQEILEQLAGIPITRWTFKDDPGTGHLGPVAQDFHAAFGLGGDPQTIATVDADGVALAAIQGLNRKLEAQLRQQADRIRMLEERLAELERGGRPLPGTEPPAPGMDQRLGITTAVPTAFPD